MAFALLIIGAVLMIAAVRGTTDGPAGLYALLKNDFTGQANFVYWIAAILIIGAVGYVPKLKSFSVAMLGLVVLVLFLKKGDPTTGVGGGFFAQLTSGLASTTTPQPVAAASVVNAPGFNQPGSIINDPFGLTTPAVSQPAIATVPPSGLEIPSLPTLTPISPLVQ